MIALMAEDRHKEMLLDCLKIAVKDVNRFFAANNGSSQFKNYFSDDNPKDIQLDNWDQNRFGIITLSPPTWFFLILTCLRGTSNHKHVFASISEKKLQKSPNVEKLINIALHRVNKANTFTIIYERAYSAWLLEHLNLCPKESVNPVSLKLSYENLSM